ncbi:transposase family protein [Staphylococcus sp. 17KM0847]|uniref:transposase family protein n=1 Tax=Staphylococcus sp. 17KM0847 TaxID=2583989 RepID=UPI0015DCDD21|nr:transposase family protein [Staphylococcus sp. 17KM0847]QLK85484.1 transposase [Staphylococcus sp. 17KM0847]
MCNDILKLLKIKDKNIQVVDVQDDVEVRGQLSTVIYGILSYIPQCCEKCGHKNESHIHKHGKRISRLMLLKSQEAYVYFNLAKQRYKCQYCQSTFTASTNIVEANCFIMNRVKLAIQDKLTQVRSEVDVMNECCMSPSTVK